MDGMRGLSVEQWVYFLENYEQVFDRAAKDFGDPDKLPLVHVEDLVYKSNRYGEITGEKRAYQVFGDDQERLGWLTLIAPSFSDTTSENRYKLDLIKMLRMDLVWSEYAVSYDMCLTNTESYMGLVRLMLGESPDGPERIANNAWVLDLGAGSGNLALPLARNGNRVIYALENNVAMLQQLKTKCRQHLVDNESDPGIRAIKQDIQSLRGIDDESFDVVLMNNVAYTLEDARSVFRQAYKKLKPGGEVRVSGPKTDTNLEALFDQLHDDLQKCENYEALLGHFERVKEINFAYLSPILYRWSLDQMKELLASAKFTDITFETDQAYAGQAMVICARKKMTQSYYS
jgi:ubiquinone/menaquinone biosynthesis C-methylase UbiE